MIALLRPGTNARRELEAAAIALLVSIAIGSLLMLIGNILSDIIYALVDPRIRFQ